ncbi:MAG TPA: pilus assembly protein TadG-related protein [Dongiaceae bacterium]|jgi:hypothetical protein|nr:pilus assembly protein TadG-related protein [Dongiaceae bacterium]
MFKVAAPIKPRQRACPARAGWLSRIARDEGGATAIITALALTVLVGFLSLGTEVGMWYAERRAMQSASDAAAMGAAFEIYKNGKNAEGIEDAGQADSRLNGFTDGSDNVAVEVNHPPTAGKFVDEMTAVETIVSKKRSTLLASLFMGNEVDIKVRSVATVNVTSVFCILALAEHEEGALLFTGTADVLLKNCGINVNSDDSDGAMTAKGASVVGASYAEIVGGLSQSNNSELDLGDVTTGADAVQDPYASLDIPAYDETCDFNNIKVNPSKTKTLTPGTYCGGIDIQGTATFQAGDYVIKGGVLIQGTASLGAGNYIIVGGKFDVRAGAIVTSDTVDGVTIFLTGGGSDYAQVNIDGTAHVSITSSMAGTYKGIAFFQDRNAPVINTGSPNTFNGASNLNVVGALYFPEQLVVFNGGNGTTGTCTRIVAYMISFSGTSGLNTDCGYGFGTPQIYPPVLAE